MPEEFVLKGKTTRHHIMAGDPRNPGGCAEHLAVMEAWQQEFRSFPDKAYVDKERIKVKFDKVWYWGPPTEKQVYNLTALDETRRHALEPHEWEITFVKKEDVVPMTEATKEKLKEYEQNRKETGQPTHRERVDGLTRMVPSKKEPESHPA
jgi:hypothetical protein